MTRLKGLQETLRGMRPTLAIGAVLGLVFGGALLPITQMLYEAYDNVYPVLDVDATLVSLSKDDVVISLRGEKQRSCQYVRMQAYGRMPDGELRAVNLMRVDTPETGITRPLGQFNFGTWRIWPRDGALSVLVYVQHMCAGRLVLTELADLAIPKPQGESSPKN